MTGPRTATPHDALLAAPAPTAPDAAGPFVVTDWIEAKPGREAALERALVPAIRAERDAALRHGAVQFELHRSTEAPGRFLLYERWVDQAAFSTFHAGTLPEPFLAFLAAADDLLARPVREVAAMWAPVHLPPP